LSELCIEDKTIPDHTMASPMCRILASVICGSMAAMLGNEEGVQMRARAADDRWDMNDGDEPDYDDDTPDYDNDYAKEDDKEKDKDKDEDKDHDKDNDRHKDKHHDKDHGKDHGSHKDEHKDKDHAKQNDSHKDKHHDEDYDKDNDSHKDNHHDEDYDKHDERDEEDYSPPEKKATHGFLDDSTFKCPLGHKKNARGDDCLNDNNDYSAEAQAEREGLHKKGETHY